MAAISGKTEEELDKLTPEQYTNLKTTAALFPDELVDSELGEIPLGWKISEIGKEVTIVGGGTPSTKNAEFWEDGDIHWTTPRDMSNLTDKILLNTDRKITEAGLAKISSGLLPINTVLMSSRAPVGYLAITKVPIAINQGYIAMKCEKVLSPEYIVQWAESVMDEIKQRASGTTFAEISKKNFKIIPTIVPNTALVSEHSKTTANIYAQITRSLRETKCLEKTRDSLLPKLLSGEIPTTIIPQAVINPEIIKASDWIKTLKSEGVIRKTQKNKAKTYEDQNSIKYSFSLATFDPDSNSIIYHSFNTKTVLEKLHDLKNRKINVVFSIPFLIDRAGDSEAILELMKDTPNFLSVGLLSLAYGLSNAVKKMFQKELVSKHAASILSALLASDNSLYQDRLFTCANLQLKKYGHELMNQSQFEDTLELLKNDCDLISNTANLSWFLKEQIKLKAS